jgi:hypothetical protein
MNTYTILVALEVEAETMGLAQELLIHRLPVPGLGPVQAWWIAEDERRDGSDNDSAVFVPMGDQVKWTNKVRDHESDRATSLEDLGLVHDAFIVEPHCPACGQPIQYCSGHGSIGDPWGHDILTAHDNGDHADCDPFGCDAVKPAHIHVYTWLKDGSAEACRECGTVK